MINSECVNVKHNVVKTGNTYFFVESDENQAVSATAVKLFDSFLLFIYHGSSYESLDEKNSLRVQLFTIPVSSYPKGNIHVTKNS